MPKRSLHGAATARACGAGLYFQQNQQERGASAGLLYFGRGWNHETKCNEVLFWVGFFFSFLSLIFMWSRAETLKGKQHFICEKLLLSGVCFHVAGPALWRSCVHGRQPSGGTFIRACEEWWRALCLLAKGIYLSVCLSIHSSDYLSMHLFS